MEKKYVLTDNVKRVDGKFVRQIRAIRNFGNIRKGTLGGFINNEENLSHEGTCWVYEDGVVAEHARVTDDAQIYQGIVFNSATVSERAQIGRWHGRNEFPHIYGNASISGDAIVRDYVTVGGFAVIKDEAHVSDFVRIDGEVVMENNTDAFHYACLFDNAHLKDNAFVCGHCKIGGNVTLTDHCYVADDSALVGNQTLSSYENKKYKLLKNDTIEVDGHTLYRIVALQDAPFCHYGELGGYVESERNLSHQGAAWIRYPMYAMGNTVISRDTVLSNETRYD
jgi:UDP-3-O-[3-hydroxymyristoyl] glucosamine N-acyltransferase